MRARFFFSKFVLFRIFICVFARLVVLVVFQLAAAVSSYRFIAVPTTTMMMTDGVVCPARTHGSVSLLIFVMPPIEIYVKHND